MNTYTMRKMENEVVRSLQYQLAARARNELSNILDALMDADGDTSGVRAREALKDQAVKNVMERLRTLLHPKADLYPEGQCPKAGRTPQDDFDAQMELEQVDTDSLKRLKDRLEKRIEAINGRPKSETDKRLAGLDRWEWELNHVNAEIERRAGGSKNA